MKFSGISMIVLLVTLWRTFVRLHALSAITQPSSSLRRTADSKSTWCRDEYQQTVTNWLDDEEIPWELQDTKTVFSKSIAIKHPIVQVNSTHSIIYLHLLKSPTTTCDCVAPTLTRDMTNYIQYINSHNDNPTKISIIHLHQDVWNSKKEICKSRLRMRLGRISGGRIFARKTVARRIESGIAIPFLQEHHLWSATKARYYYGLYYKDDLVAVATFSSRRRLVRGDTTNENRGVLAKSAFELLRFCTRRDCMVVGAISKLLKAFIRDQQPDDIVTVVDRDWGPGDGWQSVGFETLHVMAPVVMAIKDGQRRHLVGAGIQNRAKKTTGKHQSTGRPGLEPHVFKRLAYQNTQEEALELLEKHEYYPVYDAGVERLHMVVHSDDQTGLWKTSVPSYAPTYMSNNRGIRVLLAHVMALTASSSYGTPMSATTVKRNHNMDDSSVSQGHTKSWRATGGTARNATLVYTAPSSMDPCATVEVRERPGGWCTLGIVGGATKSIYHGNYKIENGRTIDSSVLVSEYLRTMAAMALVGLEFRRAHGADSDVVEENNRSNINLSFLYLGYGAGSLPRYMATIIPGSRHVAIELDEGVIKAAHHCDLVTSNTDLILGDALAYRRPATNTVTFQQKHNDFFDVVFVDIFDGENKCPKDFYSKPFLDHSIENHLGGRSDGIVIHNFHTGGKGRRTQLEDAVKGYRSAFSTTMAVESVGSNPSGGNAVILSTNNRRQDSSSETLSWNFAGRNAQRRWGVEFDVAARATQNLWLT